jgi:hypothetical protein
MHSDGMFGIESDIIPNRRVDCFAISLCMVLMRECTEFVPTFS